MATANSKVTVKPETMLMSGVPVDFPYQPYPCQIAMLGKIIKALQQSKHCLLESPTGTGKTLTLLCAALAWQQKELELSRTSSSNDSKENSSEASNRSTPVSRIFYCTRTHKQLEQVAKQLNNTIYKDKIRMTLLSSRDNYCIHPTVSKGPNKNHECVKLTRPTREAGQTFRAKGECGFYERLRGKTAGDFLHSSGGKAIPRVFDIEQFNEYCQSSHAICPYYTSRLLIDVVNLVLCPYNYLIDPRVRNSMQMSMNNAVIIIDEAHNIEDCARESMKFQMRKYDFETALEEFRVNQKALEIAQIQAAHLLTNASGFSATQEAPVNSQGLSTQQQSSARRAAGYSEYDEMNEEVNLLDHLNIDHLGHDQDQAANPVEPADSDEQDVANALKFLVDRFSRAVAWFDSKDPRESYTFTPKELIEQWHQAKFIDRSIVNIHKPATKKLPASRRGCAQDAARIRKSLGKAVLNAPDYVKFSEEIGYFLENFDLCVSVLYADDYQFMGDYKITLNTVPFEPSENALSQMQNPISTQSTEPDDPEWIDMTQKSTQFKRVNHQLIRTSYPLHTQQLNFYCLSPSVAFAKDLKLARSLIFASGTLAPLATYSGELKIPFDFQMECNHVIDVHRTFITALSHGRNASVKLRATYQNIDRFDFQDECGLVVLDVCQRVPFGVLCFVPSYRFLNLIMNRWMSSGLWQKLNEHKSVFFEEKSSANFQNTIDRFREANGTFTAVKPLSAVAKRVNAMWKRKNTSEVKKSNSPYFPIKGGLLLAVCRGRASEGIDFSDNNARCVITLGIPYPNLKDEEVVFKRDYNNEQNKRISHVMNGSDWYDSQAYRALNQALGRCIRHKDDWGALIIVDERIANSINDKYFGNKISLWIKQRLFVSRRYDETMNALEQFSKQMKTLDETAAAEAKEREKEQKATAETKAPVDEPARFSLILPPPNDPQPNMETNDQKDPVKITPRKWKVEDLSDDETESKKPNENRSITMKSKVFNQFLAQRPVSMPPPKSSPVPTAKRALSQAQHFIDLTDDDDEVDDDDDDDDEDFVPTAPSYFGRPGKKLKLK